MTPRIEPDDEGGARVYTPYDPVFVAELKALVPASERAWDPEAKCWWIASDWVEWVEEKVAGSFGEVRVADEDGHALTRTASGETLWQGDLFG